MDEIEWNVVNEGHLLEIIANHKPVGINKSFQMSIICEKLEDLFNKEVKSGTIWKHLEGMYNLEALNDIEGLPFPNDETDFTLPDSEFGDLLSLREDKDDKRASTKGKESLKTTKETKKEEKTPIRNIKETQRRDSKDSNKDNKSAVTIKKDVKKEPEKPKQMKGRPSLNVTKEENKTKSIKSEETVRSIKRPTRGSLKSEDGNNSGKSSPVSLTQGGTKRRRLNSDLNLQNL